MFAALPIEAELKAFANSVLPDARATALNQDHCYDGSEHAGNNPNSQCGVHSFSPFLQKCIMRCFKPSKLQDFNSGLRISRPSTEPENPRSRDYLALVRRR
jgi:hypothetical protein